MAARRSPYPRHRHRPPLSPSRPSQRQSSLAKRRRWLPDNSPFLPLLACIPIYVYKVYCPVLPASIVYTTTSHAPHTVLGHAYMFLFCTQFSFLSLNSNGVEKGHTLSY